MQRTISGMMGKGSVNHNTRAFSAKNVDKERSKDNIQFCNRNIKEVYHELFDEALERYNAKQKRSDRKIDNYYEKIRQGKQEKLFYEVIFQIGNKEDMNAKSEEGELAKQILIEFMKEFQKRNPNLFVFSAHLHMDEETPHIHIDFVPFICNSKRGLDTRVSLKGALGELGFKGGTRGATEWNQWIESEKKELAVVMERYGIEWLQRGTNNKHLSVLDYEKQERAKEVAELELKKQEQIVEAVQWKNAVSNSKSELIDVLSQKIQAEKDIEKMKFEHESAKKECDTLLLHNQFLKVENEELKEEKQQIEGNVKQLVQEQEDLQNDNEKLVLEQKKLEQELQSMADSKMVLERNVRAYDEDRKWQLPESSAFMTAKGYRDNKAVPLVRELKELVKKLTIRCVNLMEQIKQLKAKVEKLTNDVVFYKDRLQEYGQKMNELQQKSDDLERVRRYVGNDKIDVIVENAKKLEKIEQKSKQHQYDYKFNR